MPRFYQFAADPQQYNVTYGGGARAAESRAMGVLPEAMGAHNPRYIGPVPPSDLGPTAMGDRYLGPVPPSDLGPVLRGGGFGSLGKLGRSSYFGGQYLNGVGDSYFGGQNKDLGAALLSDNEKRLVMIGVIGLVGWFVFGDKIKKAMKK